MLTVATSMREILQKAKINQDNTDKAAGDGITVAHVAPAKQSSMSQVLASPRLALLSADRPAVAAPVIATSHSRSGMTIPSIIETMCGNHLNVKIVPSDIKLERAVMKNQKHEKATGLPRSRPGKYEETESATGAMGKPAIPPVMEKEKRLPSEKSEQKDDAGVEGE